MPDSLASPWVTRFSSTQQPAPYRRRVATSSRRRTEGGTLVAPEPRRRSYGGHRRWAARLGGNAPLAPYAVGRVLSASTFRSALIRERRRADRSNEPFALITAGTYPAVAERVAEAATALASEHCLVGWVDEGRELGLLVTGLDALAATAVAQLEEGVRMAIALAVGADAAASIPVFSYLHTGPMSVGAPGLVEADPLLEDLRKAEASRGFFRVAKRALDIAGSLVALVLFSPVFLVAAILVKLTSPGPVFFRQTRVGLRARPFPMLKFRTMQAGNDPSIHQQFVTAFIDAGTAEQVKAKDTPFKITADPRVTPIGRWLRRSSIDELPQLWNVLRGEMSLVGPRPPIDYELARYQPWHWRRVLEAKPGMTGLWQVAGRSRTSFDEMVRLDVAYARSRSIRLDLWILLQTPRAVITGKGAY